MRDTIGKLLGRLTGADTKPDDAVSGLSGADRRALTDDLAVFAKLDAELAPALTRHVLAGTDESALLRLKAVSAQNAYQTYFGTEWRDRQSRSERRAAIFLGLEGWDPPVLKRYGEILSMVVSAVSQQRRMPGVTHWPQWLSSLVLMVDTVPQQVRPKIRPDRPTGLIDVVRLLELLRLDSLGEVELIAGLFDGPDNWSRSASIDAMCKDRQLATLIAAAPEACAACLDKGGAAVRARLIPYLAAHHLVGTGIVFDRVLRLAADKAKGTREFSAITALTGVDRAVLTERAAALLRDRDVEARLAAVRILATIIGPPAKATLEAHAATESAKKILQAIAEASQAFAVLGSTAEAGTSEDQADDDAAFYLSIDGARIAIPPMPPLPADAPVPAGTEQRLRAAAVEANERARALHAERVAAGSEHHKKYPFKAPFDPAVAADVVAIMRGEPVADARRTLAFRFVAAHRGFAPWAAVVQALAALLASPDVTLRHIVRIGSVANQTGYVNSLLEEHSPVAAIITRQLAEGLDLRVLDALVSEERKAGNLVTDYLGRNRYLGSAIIDGDEVDRAQVWPWVASHFATLDQAFGLAPGTAVVADEMPRHMRAFLEEHQVPRALHLLAFLPAPPRRYLQVLTDLATTGPKATRAEARAVLAAATNLTALICGMLASGEQARRVAAALWLGERGDKAAVPPLRDALGKERTDHGRAALLSAMVRLGEDIAPHFSDQTLLPEARKALPKLRSKLTEWFPFEALPALSWADGRPVQPDILRYWLLLSDKLKQPGGNPMLHIGLDRLKRDDAERLGLFVLAAFIERDTRCPTEQEANAHAEANVERYLQQIIRYNKDYTRERAFADLKRGKLSEYLSSASDHRGILALARHAPAVDAVRMARSFFRDHSQRVAQCRALLDCLAANPAPAALQFVLAISRRHKTPSVQRYAGDLVTTVAEANSWSRDELADRTVPTGGFDETGVITLAIADKPYRIVLENDCSIAIENPDGKTVSSLPSPTGDAEANEAKDAKKRLSAARKELSQTIELQRGRLYEAMCCGRVWPAADFDAYLMRHPIMARLIRRVVFAGLDEQGTVIGTFRPLDDGSLTDAADVSTALSGFAGVKLAHRAILDDATVQAWRTHLADYEVQPLFEQLDRPALAIGPDDVERRDITDRQGHMMTTFALRTAATKLGYQRGPGEDGGVFSIYQKRFEAAGLAAVIEFTGSMLPEQNVPCALRSLSFVRAGAGAKTLALAKVPPVLVSETWNDYHALAAAGTGFDPQWEKKAAF